jgi:Lon protease-like protein
MRLPIFPLHVVLFPRMPLPLYIFEERYKLMINSCLQERRPFGVALIKSGREVGGPATPFEIGTTARIHDVERRKGGEMDLLTLGERRFRIRSIMQETPYLAAEVEELEEPLGDPARLRLLVPRAANLFDEYCRLLVRLGARRNCFPEPVTDPVTFSYQIASWMQIDLDEKQALLETDSAERRLRSLVRLLEREKPLLKILADAQERTKAQTLDSVERQRRSKLPPGFFSSN